MSGPIKIGPWHSQDKPVPFHLYHLPSRNHTCGIAPGTIYPSTRNINLCHSSLLHDLSKGIWNTLSILEGSDTSDRFLSLSYSTTNHMRTACRPDTHAFNLWKYSVTIRSVVITINTIAITDSSHISNNLSDNYPPKYHNVTTCGTPDAHPWRPWSATIWSWQVMWAILLLQRPQVSVCVIPCSWWRRNEAACPI